MARANKRKHASTAQGTSKGDPPSKKGKTQTDHDQLGVDPTAHHAVLGRFYPQLMSLRDYALSRLPSSSRLRRRKVAAVGLVAKAPGEPLSVDELSLGALLDSTLVGIPRVLSPDQGGRLEGWKTFSQKGDESYVTLSNGIAGYVESQALLVEYVVRTLFSREKTEKYPKHLLCEGYRRNGALGLRATRPNSHVQTLQQPPWPQLLALLGESGDRIMMDLLLDCAIFVSVRRGANNYCQISGKPLSEVEASHTANPRGTSQARDAKAPSDLVFVRYRMLYARPALNARGLVQFGLRHIHVLNRSPYIHEDSQVCPSGEETRIMDLNKANTLRVMMYIFPRQFQLHNAFTSKVNLKETAQRLKDYTLREEEIVENYGRLNEDGHRVQTPKRLRGLATELVRKFQILHQRCSYSALLHHHCPVQSPDWHEGTGSSDPTAKPKASRKSQTKQKKAGPSQRSSWSFQWKQDTSIIELATPSANVSAFCRGVLRNIVPHGFWGLGQDACDNENLFLRSVDRFVTLRRFEGMSLHEVAQGMKITDISWLAPPHLMAQKASKTDTEKRFELFYEFLYFLFDSAVIPLIRSNFYVTESNTDKYRLFFFRHDIWKSLVEPAMAGLKNKLLEEVSLTDAQRILDSRLLGFSQVRLLPKGFSMRPIMNLRKRNAVRGNPKELGLGINKILAPAHRVLQLEKTLHPERLGSTMFSVGDIYGRLKSFKAKLGGNHGPLFFAKVDVQSAFDTIPQAAIVSLLDSIPQQRQYKISKYLEVAPPFGNQQHRGVSKSKPIKKWPSAAISEGNTSSFLQLLEAERAATKRDTVFVDLWKKNYETSEILQLVSSHIQQNLVKIGKKYYRQKKGIPQGSVLSATLCNYFYADLERHVLPFLNSDDCLLLRLIDDFLLISTDESKASRFVEVMHQGVPEYGVAVNPRKTLISFDLMVNGQKVSRVADDQAFPYCGTLIDCRTLDLARGRDKDKATAIYNSLTVEFNRVPGQTFQRKVLNAFKIQSHLMFFDTGLNSAATILQNISNAFTETATKMWAYARCLPRPKQPSASLVIRTVTKAADMAYRLLTSKRRKTRFPGYVCDVKRCEVSWLAYKAFHEVLGRRQSKYAVTLQWLETELKKLEGLRDIRHGRVHQAR